MGLKVACARHVQTGKLVSVAYQPPLCRPTRWFCDAQASPVLIACSRSDDGPDDISIPDYVGQTLQNQNHDSFTSRLSLRSVVE